MPSVHPDSVATRRFRAFLNPQSFALGAGTELRKPQADVRHLSPEMIAAPMVLAAWASSDEGAPAAASVPLAQDEIVASGDPPDAAPTSIAGGEIREVRQASPASDQKPGQMSMLRWLFVAWGGILTAASAARMLIG